MVTGRYRQWASQDCTAMPMRHPVLQNDIKTVGRMQRPCTASALMPSAESSGSISSARSKSSRRLTHLTSCMSAGRCAWRGALEHLEHLALVLPGRTWALLGCKLLGPLLGVPWVSWWAPRQRRGAEGPLGTRWLLRLRRLRLRLLLRLLRRLLLHLQLRLVLRRRFLLCCAAAAVRQRCG